MNYYDEIKKELIDNEINKRVKDYSKNKYELEKYYNVGKLLFEAGKHYGEGIIKEYSMRLANELGKGYDVSNLKRMRQFYLLIEKGAPMEHQLSWSHYKILMTLKSNNIIEYYVYQIIKRNLSKRQLIELIKNKEYERLPEETKDKLINKEPTKVKDLIKNPIIIKNNNYEIVSEKALQKLILEDIESFMKELGNSFGFIGSEYRVQVGNHDYFIDLLFYNRILNCFIIIENKKKNIIVNWM